MKLFKKILKIIGLVILAIILVSIIAYTILVICTSPSNNRNWAKDMGQLASAEISTTTIKISNIRDINYRGVLDYDLKYKNETFDISKITKAYLFTDPFGKLSAHTMLGFEFSDGKRVVLSVEVRREVGEWFSGIKGILRQYELIFVWATEKDVVKLRTNHRGDNVYMYEMKMAKPNIEKLFVAAVMRTNKLVKKPEFYNTLTNNCTTNLANLLQNVYNKPIVVDWKYLAPAYAEALSMKYDLIDGPDIPTVRATHNISPLAKKCGDCDNYSEEIRKILLTN
ncbi:MAG: DUF4105 domain-containing protein [bacterium]